MLKKLMKNELKATSRIYAVIYVVFAALLIVERLSLLTVNVSRNVDGVAGQLAQSLVGIATVLTFLGVIALWVTPAVYCIYRFYKNMLSDEGYLSFTLPVTVSQHLWSKVIVACIWQVAAVVFSCLAGALFLYSLNRPMFGEILMVLKDYGHEFGIIAQNAGGWFYFMLFLLAAVMLLRMAVTYLNYFCAMSIGQCANKHKFLLSVAVYIGIRVALSMALQVLGILLLLVSRGDVHTMFNAFLTSADPSLRVCQAICIGLLIVGVLDLLLGLLYFLLSRHFLTKKLNLA